MSYDVCPLCRTLGEEPYKVKTDGCSRDDCPINRRNKEREDSLKELFISPKEPTR